MDLDILNFMRSLLLEFKNATAHDMIYKGHEKRSLGLTGGSFSGWYQARSEENMFTEDVKSTHLLYYILLTTISVLKKRYTVHIVKYTYLR